MRRAPSGYAEQSTPQQNTVEAHCGRYLRLPRPGFRAALPTLAEYEYKEPMHSEDRSLVIGMDIGGTTSRAVVTDLVGNLLGTGAAEGGNPNSHPPEQAVERVAEAARSALSAVPPGAVLGGVLGMAGVSKMADPAVAGLFDRTWPVLGLSAPMRVVCDSEVAFAAGTPAPAGTVLIAGTGAVAARVDRHRLVGRAGGYGWLLGDEGSAFWLGREAVRRTLRALDHREPDTGELVSAVLSTLHGTSDTGPEAPRTRVLTQVNAAPPIRLAELAPLVTSAARAGDKAAIDIVQHAAAQLADTAEDARHPDPTAPIVLTGSLVATGNPVGDALRTELAARWSGPLRTAGSGAAGAAWLAARDFVDPDAGAALHARLLG